MVAVRFVIRTGMVSVMADAAQGCHRSGKKITKAKNTEREKTRFIQKRELSKKLVREGIRRGIQMERRARQLHLNRKNLNKSEAKAKEPWEDFEDDLLEMLDDREYGLDEESEGAFGRRFRSRTTNSRPEGFGHYPNNRLHTPISFVTGKSSSCPVPSPLLDSPRLAPSTSAEQVSSSEEGWGDLLMERYIQRSRH